MKRVFALLLCLCLIVSVFAACTPEAGNGGDVTTGGNDGGETHVHTYETTWSKDAEGHWYEATCECEDLEITKTAHTDKDQDKACDVCGYTEHTHTYTEDWQTDAQNHWHAPDCGCPIDNIDVAAHVDENDDGKCDVCAYVIKEHIHTYAEEWSGDEGYHWHATTCGHDDIAITDKAPHRINDAGLCTVCGMQLEVIDPSDIKAVLGAAVALDDKVTDGKVIFNEMPDGNFGRRNEVVYTLGNGQAYIIYSSLDENDNHLQDLYQWAERLSDDNIFAVQRDGADGEFTVVAGSPHLLTGYNYMPGNLLSAGYDDVNTLALFVYNMYDQMSNGTNVMNAVENYDAENGIYTFSYEWFFVDKQTSGGEVFNISVEYFVVDVEFTIDETGVINAADVTVTSYRNWEMDCDLDYDQATNTVTLRDTATPTIYDYTVTQTSGERTFENPYSKDVMIPSDFELYYVTGTDYNDDGHQYIVSEELIEGTLTLEKDEYVRLHLGNLIPSTALPDFMDTSDFEFTFTNKTEGATGVLWKDQDFLRPSYNPLTLNSITFKVADPGEYTMTIRFGKVTKTIEIVVPGETVSELPESDASNVYVETTDTYVWDVDSFTYTAGEEGTYTFNLPAGLGIMKNGADAPAVDFYDNANGATASFDLAAGESVVLYVSAITKDVWHITVDFVAGDVGGGDTPGGGDEPGGDPTSVTITPGTYDLEGNTLVINADGTMVFTYGTSTLNYTYAVDGTTITYTLNDGAPYTADSGMAIYFGCFTFDADGNAKGFYYNGTEYALTAGGGDQPGGETPEVPETDALKDSLAYQMPVVGSYNLMFLPYNEEYGYIVNIYNSYFDLYFTYNVENVAGNDYAITVTYFARPDFEINPDMAATIETEVFNATYDGVEWSFAGGDEPGGDEPGGDEPGDTDALKDSLAYQMPTVGSYNLMFLPYTDENGYLVNVYGTGFDLYFTYNVENVGGDRYAITVTYFARPDFESGAEMAETIETEVFYATYDGIDWAFEGSDVGGGDEPGGTDTLKDSLAYQMPAVGDYNLMFLPYDETNGYLVNVYGTGFDLYFTYNVENVGGNDYAITVTYFARPDFETNPDMAATIETEVFNATYDGVEWSFGSDDPETPTTADGSFANPYELEENNSCDFPGGWNYVFYKYTAQTAGTLTITVSGSDFYWAYGAGEYMMENVGQVATGEITLAAGETVYIGMSTNSGSAGIVEFTSSFAEGGSGEITPTEPDGSFANPYELQENNTCDFPGGWNYIFYKYTARTAGTLTITVSGSDFYWGYGASEYALNNVAQVATADITLAAGETVYIGMSTNSANAGVIEFTATFGEGSGSEQPQEPGANELVIGNNSINAADINFAYTATEDGVLTLELGNAIMGPVEAAVQVNNGAVQMLYTGSTVTLNLTTGDVVTVQVTASGYATLIASWSNGGSETPEGPAGTESDPIPVTLPADVTVEYKGNGAAGMVWYSFTLTETGNFTITFDGTDNWFFINQGTTQVFQGGSAAQLSYSTTLEAGDYTIGIATWSENAATLQVNMSVESVGGSGESGASVTYMSARHASGRYLQVTIDTSAGTMTLVRSNMSGGWDASTSTAEYTYSYAGGTVTVENVSGQVCTFTWNADGTPASITWGSAVFTDFAQQ